MTWVLDTSFLIDVQHKDPKAIAFLEMLQTSGRKLLVPGQVVAEFLAGTEPGYHLVTFHRIKRAFTLVPTDESQMMEAGRLGRLSADRGQRPRWADIQIAAVANLHSAEVVTANPKDFLALDVLAVDPRDDATPAAA